MTFSVVDCFLFAEDEANSDAFQLAFGVYPAYGAAASPVVSGGMTID